MGTRQLPLSHLSLPLLLILSTVYPPPPTCPCTILPAPAAAAATAAPAAAASTQPRPWGCQTQAESSSARDSLEMKRVPRVAYPTRFRTLTHILGTYESCTHVRARAYIIPLICG